MKNCHEFEPIPILGYNYQLRLICWPHPWVCDIRQGRDLPASRPAESQHRHLQAAAGKLNPDTVSWGPILRGANPHLNSPPRPAFLEVWPKDAWGSETLCWDSQDPPFPAPCLELPLLTAFHRKDQCQQVYLPLNLVSKAPLRWSLHSESGLPELQWLCAAFRQRCSNEVQ